MNRKQISLIAIAAVSLLSAVALYIGGIGHNLTQNWQVIQYPGGDLEVRDEPGYYLLWFGDVTTYPREVESMFGEQRDFGTIRTSFNDNGEGHNEGYVRYQTPLSEEERLAFHRKYTGNIDNATRSVMAFATRTMKVTAPTMSASEHKQARKAEFLQMVDDQLHNGTYHFEQVVIDDPSGLLDENGKRFQINSTQVLRNKETGSVEYGNTPPFQSVGIDIVQFEITKTDYDTQSKKQFAARQDSLLAAQTAKANTDKERQSQAEAEARGLREKAEAEATANVIKAEREIDAQMKVAVAQQAALEAEMKAQQRVLVAEQERQEQETILATRRIEADQLVAVAEGQRRAAVEEAAAIVILAEAEEERIARAGAMTEMAERTLQIAADRDAKVATALATIKVPGVVMGGGGEGGDAGTMAGLINMLLLKQGGLLPEEFVTNQ